MAQDTSTEMQAPTVDEDGYYILQGALFWRWRAHDAEARALAAALEAKTTAIRAEIEKVPGLAQLYTEHASLAAALSAKKGEQAAVLKEIATAFGITGRFGIDDQTGRMYVLDENGAEVRLGPPAPAQAPARAEAPAPQGPNKKARRRGGAA